MAESDRLVARARRAVLTIREFVACGKCYVALSWGKDSVVLAHLVWMLEQRHRIRLPCVQVVTRPVANPYVPAVRDAFLARFPVDYHEIVIDRHRSDETQCAQREHRGSRWGWMGANKEKAFACASRRFGARYISGIRGAESSSRNTRMMKQGTSTQNTCAPIGWWTGIDVWAYIARHDLPVHPSYAMSFAGRLDRDRLRVGNLGGSLGTGFGRAEWEGHYYRDRIRWISELTELKDEDWDLRDVLARIRD